jgi:hypothetical protein
MANNNPRQPVSPRKLAANRKNSKRSTGPRTPDGKRRASNNSYKHGFYSTRLFPSKEQTDRDGKDFQTIYAMNWHHYSPVGDLENLCVEQIAVLELRLARLLGHEQTVLAWGAPFESRSVDKIVRYESNLRRQLEKTLDRLERLQEERETESDQFEPSDIESGDVPEEQQDATTSNDVPEAFQTITEPHVETSTGQASVMTVVKPWNKPVESAPTAPPHPLVKVVEQVLDLTPAEQPEKGSGSDGNCETYPNSFRSLIETPEDAELVERIKRGDDLEELDLTT